MSASLLGIHAFLVCLVLIFGMLLGDLVQRPVVVRNLFVVIALFVVGVLTGPAILNFFGAAPAVAIKSETVIAALIAFVAAALAYNGVMAQIEQRRRERADEEEATAGVLRMLVGQALLDTMNLIEYQAEYAIAKQPAPTPEVIQALVSQFKMNAEIGTTVSERAWTDLPKCKVSARSEIVDMAMTLDKGVRVCAQLASTLDHFKNLPRPPGISGPHWFVVLLRDRFEEVVRGGGKCVDLLDRARREATELAKIAPG